MAAGTPLARPPTNRVEFSLVVRSDGIAARRGHIRKTLPLVLV